METKEITIYEAVAERTIQLLEEKGISLFDLANKCGGNYEMMETIITQKNVYVDFDVIVKIACGLGMTVSQFFDSPLFDEPNLKF